MNKENKSIFGQESEKSVADFTNDIYWAKRDLTKCSLCERCKIMLTKKENGIDVWDFSRKMCSNCLTK